MATLRYAPGARDDLSQITAYIAHDNLTAALRWLKATEGLCDLLAAYPGMGQRVKTTQFGTVRRHAAGNYLIYYRPIPTGVEILRIKHAARDQAPPC